LGIGVGNEHGNSLQILFPGIVTPLSSRRNIVSTGMNATNCCP
jgi:hypothetical protein